MKINIQIVRNKKRERNYERKEIILTKKKREKTTLTKEIHEKRKSINALLT